jgi:hypothetical protein
VNAYSAVQAAAIARGFARVITDPAMDGGKGIVRDDRFPSFAVAARLRQIEPGLDIFAGRAGIVARRHEIDIKWALDAGRASTLLAQQIYDRCKVRLARWHD